MEKVEDLLVDGCIRNIKLTREDIHTRTVRIAIGRKGPIRVPGTNPPEINEDMNGSDER